MCEAVFAAKKILVLSAGLTKSFVEISYNRDTAYLKSLFRIFFRTSFQQILPVTASKILAIRLRSRQDSAREQRSVALGLIATESMPADFFLVTDKIMRKNPHIKRHGTSSKGNAEIRMERKRKVRGSFTGNQGDDIGRRAQW